jgi:hypothetical protein
MMVNLSLVENALAASGPVRVYVKLTGPDGEVITTGATSVTIGGVAVPCVASREVDYQGAEVEICIYFDYAQPFTKGVYSVEAYTTEGKLGSADLLLK